MAVNLRYLMPLEFNQMWNADPTGTMRSIENFLAGADVDDAYMLGRVVGDSLVQGLDSKLVPFIKQEDLDSFDTHVTFIAGYWGGSDGTPATEIVDLIDKMQQSAGSQFKRSYFSLIYLGVALLRLSDNSWEKKHPIRSELKRKLMILQSDLRANHSHLTLAIARLDMIP